MLAPLTCHLSAGAGAAVYNTSALLVVVLRRLVQLLEPSQLVPYPEVSTGLLEKLLDPLHGLKGHLRVKVEGWHASVLSAEAEVV